MKRMLKIRKKLLAAMCVVLLAGMFPVTAGAAENDQWLNEAVDYKKTQIVYVAPKDKEYDNYRNGYMEVLFPAKLNISAKKIKNLKSSNPKVLKTDGVVNETSAKSKKKAVVLEIFTVKPGKSTVSFKYNGKTYKINYVVEKFGNGFKYLKLDGYKGDYASKFNTHIAVDVKGQKRPSNIQIKMKSNWVVKEVTVVSSGVRGFEKTIFSSNKGKSSVTVKDEDLNQMDLMVKIQCQNKKTGEEASYNLQFEMLDFDDEDDEY